MFYYQIKPQKGTQSTKCHKDHVKRINYTNLFPLALISFLFLSDLLVSFLPDREARWEVGLAPLCEAMRRCCVSQERCESENIEVFTRL